MAVFIRTAKRLGNSAGILLPKKFLGSEVKVTIIKRPVNLRKKVLSLMTNYLPDILGVYIIDKENLEVLAISSNIKTIIQTDKIKINIVPLAIVKKDLQTKQELKQKISKASTILNHQLISDLRKI